MAEEWPRPLPDHVTTPLLTRITEGSLDEDYRQVALRKTDAGAGPVPPARPHLVAAVVIAAFGVLVTTAAVQTSRNADVTDASRATLITRVNAEHDSVDQQQEQIARLQDGNIVLEGGLDAADADLADAETALRRLEVRTGYVAVTGPGVRVTVNDAPGGDVTQLVRDEDLAILVDGLWRAGAEAIAINGQRLTVLSAIRNVGPAVHVNSRPVNPPYVVQAIGDVRTLQANLLDTTHGQQFFELADDLGFQYSMENEDELSLPGARGPRLHHVRRLSGQDKPGMDKKEAAP